jgi:hypothetical protein
MPRAIQRLADYLRPTKKQRRGHARAGQVPAGSFRFRQRRLADLAAITP